MTSAKRVQSHSMGEPCPWEKWPILNQIQFMKTETGPQSHQGQREETTGEREIPRGAPTKARSRRQSLEKEPRQTVWDTGGAAVVL